MRTGGRAIAAVLSGLWLAAASSVHGQVASQEYYPWNSTGAQFLNREFFPWWDERYENYSLLSYRDYGAIASQRENATYDPFGAYLLDGVELLRLGEYRTLSPRQSSQIFRDYRFRTAFRNLVVMRDHHRGWSSRLMLGDALEARFTPLTLNQPRLQGLRWDASSHKNRFSVIASRVSSPIDEGNNDVEFATYLLGGHWESQLGDVLTLGASYVNLHLRDGMQRDGSLRGQFPSALGSTRDYFAIFSDDSPEDRSGTQVYAVEVYVNGVRADLEPDIRRVEGIVQPEHVAQVRRHGAWATQGSDGERLLDPRRGAYFTSGVPVDRQLPWEVGGTDLLVFRYAIPNDVEALQFRAQVAGDYSIDVGASFPWEDVASRRWSDWHNVARAPGNVRDGSNLRWVSFEYSFLTGLVQYGSNAELRVLGATLQAEYVDNLGSRQFPHVSAYHRESRKAYFAKLSRPLRSGTVGAEYFHMPSRFQTEMPMWSEHAGDVISYDLVRDNDDDDVWPDRWEHWDPLDPLYVALKGQTGFDPEGQPTQEAEDNLSGNLGSGLGFGVYPGLDLNDDTVLDINVTRNATPDYAEPFLMYSVEPDEFVYGDDYNNNGVVDARENDNLPDYPYPLDSGGHHLFGELPLGPGTTARAGRYRVEQRAGDGRSFADYLELRHYRSGAAGTGLELDYRLRRVRDDIADPVYRVVPDPLAATQTAVKIQHDPLLMRDSWVNTVFAEARRAMGGTRVTAASKFEVNSLRGGKERAVSDWYGVLKADYTYGRGGLRLMPMAKLLTHRRRAPAELLTDLSTYELFPILRLDYDLGPRTVVRAGVQGLPGWPHRFRDGESPLGDFDARHYIFVVQNSTNYTGYELSINMGYRSSHTRYVGVPSRRVHRLKEFFVQARVL